MNKSYKYILGLVCAVLLGGCATGTPKEPIRKVAIVSLVINGEDLDHFDPVKTATTEKIVNGKFAAELVITTEKKLSAVMQINPVSGFVGNADYQGTGVKPQPPYTLPQINGKSMVLFSAIRREQVKGELNPEIAKKLCANLHVDAVVLIYSEWSQKRGGRVPTIRPYTDNFVAIWDSHGDLVLRNRVGKMGDIQGIGMVNISSEKLPDWTRLYIEFLNDLAAEMKNLSG